MNSPPNLQDPSGLQVALLQPVPIANQAPRPPISIRPPIGGRASKCPPGTIFVGNDPRPNGCSAPRVGLALIGLGNNVNCPIGGANFENMCNIHDDCYSTCGTAKAACDQLFLQDLMQACAAAANNPKLRCPANAANFNLQVCRARANLYAGGVAGQAAQNAYNDAQNNCAGHCVCLPNLV